MLVAWIVPAVARAEPNVWTSLGPIPYARSVAITPGPPYVLYTSSDYIGGAFSSTDGGITWDPAGTLAGAVDYWAFPPSAPNIMYAVVAGAVVYTSGDGGLTWSRGKFIPRAIGITGFAVHPSSPLTAYVVAGSEGVYRTTNAGGEWEPWGSGLPDEVWCRSLFISPADPSTQFLETSFGAYKSIDAGEHWNRMDVSTSVTAPLALDPSSPNVLYTCGVDPVARIVRSADGGATWTAGAGLCPDDLRAMIVDPVDPSRLWGHTVDQVFTSRDAGEHWYSLGAPMFLGRGWVLAVDPSRPGRLYVATDGQSVMAYDDRCGNGVLDAHETCDDGNPVDGDGCRPDCSIEAHGDGRVDPDEECDDGNFVDGDGCDGNLTTSRCGNGVVTAGEECDDGNADETDHCGLCRRQCVTAAECDDGEPCTIEVCTQGVCGWRFAAGTELTVCSVHGALDAVSCSGVALPAAFKARLDDAVRELELRASSSAGPGSVRGKFRQLARRSATLRRRLPRACVRQLRRALLDAAETVRSTWPR